MDYNFLHSIGAFFAGLIAMVSPVFGNSTITQLNPWYSSAGTIRLSSTTATIRVPFLANCDTIDTNGSGVFACGTDATGGSGGSGTVSTSTIPTVGQLAYWTSNGFPSLLGSVATGTVSSSGGITTTALRSVIGGALSIACDIASGSIPGCLATTDWTTFSSKLGSYDAWTHPQAGTSATTSGLILSASSTATWFSMSNATTTNATTTNFNLTNQLTFNGITGTTWAAFCTTITGGAGLCDGTDATGAGGAAAVATSTSETAGRLSYWTSTSGSPALLGEVATTTLTASSPLSLSQTVLKVGGSNSVLTIATSTNSLFGGTAGDILAFINGGWFGISTTTLSTGTGVTVSAGAGALVGGSNATVSLTSISAGVLGSVTSAIPTSQATSTLYGASVTAGHVLTSNGSSWITAATSTCIQITGSAGLCDGDDATGTGGAFPFTPTTNYGQQAQATTTALWMQATPFSFFASSTAVFVNSSSTQITNTGNTWLTPLTSALLQTDGAGLLAEYAGTTCTNQFVRVLSALGIAMCESVSLSADVTGSLALTSLAAQNANTFIANATGGSAVPTAVATSSIFGASNTAGHILAWNNNLPQWVASSTLSTITGTLAVSNGGTGLTAYTLGDVLYASGTGTLAGTSTPNLKATLALANVENTALSTWAGSTNITTLGTIATGVWSGTAIGATKGGTGATTVTTGDLLYGSASNVWSKLAGVATGNALLSGGVSTAPSWGKIALTTHVSGTLPVANGGTGAVTLTGLLQGNGTSAITGIANSSTVGQILRVTGASTYAWGALDLDDADAFTGTLPIANTQLAVTAPIVLTTDTLSLGNVKQYPSFVYATSTAWTGTTTIPLGPAFVAETWNSVMCFTDVGTLNVSFEDTTPNRMNLFNASTTVGTVVLSTNNTFVAAEKRYVDVGTPATAPKSISCTVSKTLLIN